MDYISTRGRAPTLTFDDVVLTGLARDGGLYVPAIWPKVSADEMAAMRSLSYPDLAARVLARFAEPDLNESELTTLTRDAYACFDHEDVAPLTRLGDDEWLLHLIHGPTLAFKDYALQVLGRLFDLVLAKRDARMTVLGATSGDTGAAAIEACRDRDRVQVFMLHPKGRVSEVQRRQMTTVDAANIVNIAIEGTFDDCQDLVKAAFNDIEFRDRMSLSAVNSINWARIAGQVVYYVWASLKLSEDGRKVDFSVPTGNFGNVFAAHVARLMGFPIRSLVIGSNRNDILTRFFDQGEMRIESVEPSLSPSMDIQVSSNFERYLFELFDRDGAATETALADFRRAGVLGVDPAHHQRACADFSAARFSDDQTLETIRDIHAQSGNTIDPHSAVGIAAARARRIHDGTPMVSVVTAHPAKFPDAVEAAIGTRPSLPNHLADLYERKEKVTELPVDIGALKSLILNTGMNIGDNK
jgi:threonine synthase